MKHFKFVDSIKRWGFLRFLYAAFMWRIGSWFRISCVFTRDLRAEPALPTLAEGRSVRAACSEELLNAAKDPELQLDTQFVRGALQRGETCIAIFEQNEIIAYGWIAVEPTPHINGITIVFEKPYRYGFNAFTHPRYRQQNLQHVIALITDPMLIEQGYTKVISFVETHNYPSLMSSFSRGNHRVGYAGYLILFGKFFSFRTRGVREVGFDFYRRS